MSGPTTRDITRRVPTYAYFILAAGWLVWVVPFFLAQRRPKQSPMKLDRRARWGIFVQAVAYMLLWQNSFWTRSPGVWRVSGSVIFLLLASALSWSATSTLGRQWRLDAGLNSDHELVRSGVYHIVRHPIYTSMFCLLLGFGLMVTPWPSMLIAVVILLIGTEIRVRVEDAMLADHFGEQFRHYQGSVGAYLPFAISSPKR
ncbi:MAG: Isoprenylcysteine carboxyl methyltransferase [Phycisphaerales bacterium]|nr:Isoprenylcysteine carboxyl methyltransferase [Phycisphaerales bacterium]